VKSRWTVAALACAFVILALGPFVLTVMRADDYSSSAGITFADPAIGRQMPEPESFVAGPLELRDLQRTVARQVDWLERAEDLPEHVSIQQVGGPERSVFLVEARGAGPAEAQELATVAAKEVTSAAETAGQFWLASALQAADRQLRRGDLPPSELEDVRARRDQLQEAVDEGARIFNESPSRATQPSERAADRLLGALPGERPARPDPLWAALAGLALALALLTWVLVLNGADSRRRPSAPG
jgi:hypothetical protein